MLQAVHAGYDGSEILHDVALDVRPGEVDRLPRQGVDLYLNIDDGHDYRLPADLRPAAWWVIDTHLNLDRDLQKAPDFDLVFAAQRPGAEAIATSESTM